MTPIRPGTNYNPAARSESPPGAASQAPGSASRQPSRIGSGAAQAGEAGEPLRRSPSPTRQRSAQVPAAAAPEATSVAGSSEAAAHWRSELASAPRAAHWNELATCRAVLLNPAAGPQTRGVGEQLAALQRNLMSFEVSRAEFEAAAHAVDSEIQAHADMPGQAALIAYADLQVQWQTADRRWPKAAPEPGPRGSAEEA